MRYWYGDVLCVTGMVMSCVFLLCVTGMVMSCAFLLCVTGMVMSCVFLLCVTGMVTSTVPNYGIGGGWLRHYTGDSPYSTPLSIK